MRRVPLLLLLLPAWLGCVAEGPLTSPAFERPRHLEQEPAPPGERYYCLIFSAQSVPKLPRFSHTWATVVRVSQGEDGGPPALDAQTISWMPAVIDIHPYDFFVEPGVNLDLCSTMREMQARGERVSLWGPFEMRPSVYRNFLSRKRFVESGRLAYQAIDVVGEAAWGGDGSNCIHAVTDADPAFGRGPTLAFGDDAGSVIAAQLAGNGALVCPEQTHDWLIAALGLGGCPIVRRTARLPAER